MNHVKWSFEYHFDHWRKKAKHLLYLKTANNNLQGSLVNKDDKDLSTGGNKSTNFPLNLK